MKDNDIKDINNTDNLETGVYEYSNKVRAIIFGGKVGVSVGIPKNKNKEEICIYFSLLNKKCKVGEENLADIKSQTADVLIFRQIESIEVVEKALSMAKKELRKRFKRNLKK